MRPLEDIIQIFTAITVLYCPVTTTQDISCTFQEHKTYNTAIIYMMSTTICYSYVYMCMCVDVGIYLYVSSIKSVSYQ
jgi:hypothetical protein